MAAPQGQEAETMSDEQLSEKEPLFWTCDDSVETLSDTEMDEAIESYLDRFWPSAWEFKDRENERVLAFVAALPAKLEVYGFVRSVVPAHMLDPDDVIDEAMQKLDEDELGDAFGDTSWEDRISPEGLESVKAAAYAFTAAVLKNYVPWSCDKVKTVEVDPLVWIKENRPEWLDGASHKAGIA